MSMTVCARREDIPPDCRIEACAVSGGTLEGGIRAMLAEATGKLCLELRPVYMDFPLPCHGGAGTELNEAALRARYQGQECHVSQALGINYFTEVRDGIAHAVVFDSRETLEMRFRAAEHCGVPYLLVEDGALRALLGA